MIPFRTPSFLPWLAPDLVWRMPTQEKQIFLTFDDGPIPGPTEFVLEALDKYKAKSTFFCIGDNVRKYPTIFTQLAIAGHAIGNHTFNHIKGWNHSTKDYLDNIESCKRQFQTILPSVTGSQQLFRPPYGRITSGQIKALKDNYKVIMWDVLTRDYQMSMSQERCLTGSIQATRSGSIVVFHDSLRAERNLNSVLPRYLEHFSNLGFVFSSL
jgi:peptidoglycan-N-acetylglucosamine deacetylase